MIKIQLAQTGNRKGINALTEEFNTHGYTHSSQYFDEAIATKKIFVALDNDKVIGYLIYHILWGNTPFLELLRITNSYQKKGIGAQLLSALEIKLIDEGFHELLSSSEKINDLGNFFHKRKGFKGIGELNMIYGKELFYLKLLSPNK